MECRDRKMMQVTLADELHYRIGQLNDPAAGDCLALLGLLAKLTFELEDEVTRPVTNQTLTLLYDGLGRLIGLRNSLSPTGDEFGELNKEIRNYTQTMVMLIGWEFAAKQAPVAQAQPQPCECDEPVAADEEPLEAVSVTPIEDPIEYLESTPEAEPPCQCCEAVEATPALEPCDCCQGVEATPAEEPCECAEVTPAEEPDECAEATPAEEPCECAEATPAGGACECTEATPTEEPRECAPAAADGEANETGEPA